MHGWPVSEITLRRESEAMCDDRHVCGAGTSGQTKAPARRLGPSGGTSRATVSGRLRWRSRNASPHYRTEP
jgi:hypothetical protein